MLDEYLQGEPRGLGRVAGLHVASELYDVEGFRAGRSSLTQHRGGASWARSCARARRLLHLQCHFGLDTLSWARRGADRHRRGLLGRGHRAGARAWPTTSASPGAPRSSRADVYRPPEVLDGASSTWSSPRGARSSGSPTWRRGPRSSPRYLKPGRHLLHRRVPPVRLPARRRRDAPTPCASATPTSSTASRCASTNPAPTPIPTAQTVQQRHLRVEPRVRRDHRPAAAQRPAPRVPARVPLHARACRSPSWRRATTAGSGSRARRDDFPLSFSLKMTRRAMMAVEDGLTARPARARRDVLIGDEDLLDILEAAIDDERAAQDEVPATASNAAPTPRPAPCSSSSCAKSRPTSAPWRRATPRSRSASACAAPGARLTPAGRSDAAPRGRCQRDSSGGETAS